VLSCWERHKFIAARMSYSEIQIEWACIAQQQDQCRNHNPIIQMASLHGNLATSSCHINELAGITKDNGSSTVPSALHMITLWIDFAQPAVQCKYYSFGLLSQLRICVYDYTLTQNWSPRQNYRDFDDARKRHTYHNELVGSADSERGIVLYQLKLNRSAWTRILSKNSVFDRQCRFPELTKDYLVAP
jgi:hypothetical protein